MDRSLAKTLYNSLRFIELLRTYDELSDDDDRKKTRIHYDLFALDDKEQSKHYTTATTFIL
jgi:hypothetical protein